jgi:hypothetical protein
MTPCTHEDDGSMLVDALQTTRRLMPEDYSMNLEQEGRVCVGNRSVARDAAVWKVSSRASRE